MQLEVRCARPTAVTVNDLTGAGVLRTYFAGVLQLPIRDAQSGRIGIALDIQDAVPWMEAPVDALESRMELQRFLMLNA